jgi:hypothetical protein
MDHDLPYRVDTARTQEEIAAAQMNAQATENGGAWTLETEMQDDAAHGGLPGMRGAQAQSRFAEVPMLRPMRCVGFLRRVSSEPDVDGMGRKGPVCGREQIRF